MLFLCSTSTPRHLLVARPKPFGIHLRGGMQHTMRRGKNRTRNQQSLYKLTLASALYSKKIRTHPPRTPPMGFLGAGAVPKLASSFSAVELESRRRPCVRVAVMRKEEASLREEAMGIRVLKNRVWLFDVVCTDADSRVRECFRRSREQHA